MRITLVTLDLLADLGDPIAIEGRRTAMYLSGHPDIKVCAWYNVKKNKVEVATKCGMLTCPLPLSQKGFRGE